MVAILNALLYVIALSLSLAMITPVQRGASRVVRVARAGLAFGGAVSVTGAIALSLMGMWWESAMVGVVAVVIVSACMWFALSQTVPDTDDGDDGSDGGGGQKRPPLAPEPIGPAPDLWTEFDRARASWERDRERGPVSV